jgi:hypothetical protein
MALVYILSSNELVVKWIGYLIMNQPFKNIDIQVLMNQIVHWWIEDDVLYLNILFQKDLNCCLIVLYRKQNNWVFDEIP